MTTLIVDEFTDALQGHNAGLLSEAEGLYRRILDRDPLHLRANINLAAVLIDSARFEESEIYSRRALSIEPDRAGTRFNLAMALLGMGRYQEGWTEYEWRWQSLGQAKPNFAPQWMGEPLNGERIFLYPEQGFGDCLQALRFAPVVAARGGRVVLGAEPEMERLSHRVLGVERVVRNGTRGPPIRWQCPLMSLPLAFGTDIWTIPAQVPYIWPEPRLAEFWSQRLSSFAGLRVGLVWAGRPTHKADRLRSLGQLARLASLAKLEQVTFFSLQKGPASVQASKPPEPLNLVNLEPELRDFADTAAAIVALDLVITIDTSVAHLAGAMGKPVWIMLPKGAKWRWLQHRADSPWYPSARLFRQPAAGDWRSVVEDIERELKIFRDGRVAGSRSR